MEVHDRSPEQGKVLDWVGTSAAGLIAQLLLQIACGIVLHFQFKPTLSSAHASVEAIRNGGPLLQFLQNFHYWGSALLIVHSFIHLTLMVWFGLYRPPHTIRFVASIAVFLCAFLFQVTGNLLPMDRHDVQTAVIEAGIGGGMPVVGPATSKLILQGDTFNQATLDAWYLVHRWLLPALALLAIGAAIVAHRRLKDSSIRILWAALPIALVAVLAFSVKAPAGAAAQPVDYQEYNALVSWYTWPMHGALSATQSISPSLGWIGAGLLPGLFVGFLVLLPLLRNRVPATAARLTFMGFVLAFGILAVGFGGKFAPLTGDQDPLATVAGSPNGVEAAPIDQALAGNGKKLFNQLDCAGCHGKDGVGGQGSPALTKVFEKHSDAEWYVKFIKDPKSIKPASTMPGFPELKEDQLAALAEYLRAPK